MTPLAGITILDLTHALSGPTCTQMLAQLGAEVIKVEPPGRGDDFRHYTEHAGLPGLSIPFAAVNAGKRSIALDLKSEAGRAILFDLAARADVVVENFRPGTLHRLGIGFARLHEIKPSLVCASITGFGQTGPFRDWGAYDHIAQAMSGIAMMNQTSEGPLKIGMPIIDSFSGYLAVIAILAALRQRDLTGEGAMLDVAMLDAALKLNAVNVSTYFYTGNVPKGTGNRGFRLVATAEYYPTKDGWIALGANHQPQVEALFRALGAPELLDDPRFGDHPARVAHYDELKAWLTERLSHQNADELEALLTTARIPAARLRDIGEISEDPHIAARGLLQAAMLPGRDDPITILGPGFGTGESADSPAVPALGADGREILAELGRSPEEIDGLFAKGVIG
jgi:crotonobetainyl-CoA:carnitine CoA-transferase CaiB-like acyl-CoA transferase